MPDKRLLECLSQLLKIDPDGITMETSQANTPAWDSIAHLQLVFEIEDTFGIRLSTEEIPQATSLGRLQEILERHQAV